MDYAQLNSLSFAAHLLTISLHRALLHRQGCSSTCMRPVAYECTRFISPSMRRVALICGCDWKITAASEVGKSAQQLAYGRRKSERRRARAARLPPVTLECRSHRPTIRTFSWSIPQHKCHIDQLSCEWVVSSAEDATWTRLFAWETNFTLGMNICLIWTYNRIFIP